jgi:hypothetical protein
MFEENEKRHFHRVFYNAKANLSSNEQNWDCDVLDLSLNGCLLRFPSPWQESSDNIYTLRLRLSDALDIKMELKIAHLLENKVGFKCEQMDIDSITQLRRIVELNVGNSEILESALASLAEKAYN